MIVLDGNNQSLEALLSGSVATNQLPIVASYLTYVSGTSFNQEATPTVTNNTTAVTIVAAPASGRNLMKSLSILNIDTAAATVTVRYNDNTTMRNIVAVTLAIGDGLCYEDGQGWYVLDLYGNRKAAYPQLGSNQGTTNNTTEVTLVAAPGAGVKRKVVGMTVFNADTAAVTLTVRRKVSGTVYRLAKVVLPADATWQDDRPRYMTATTHTITAVLAGAVSANQPEYWTDYEDY